MDSKRARDIFNSLGVIDVYFQGAPVWIEGLQGDQAEVECLQSGKRFKVPVGELEEKV